MEVANKDPKYYEDLIRRMKVLSVSQSTFLKAFVHWKLSAGVSLVQRSLDLIGTKGSNNDPRVIELKNALAGLKLNELEADVNSSQLMMQEELGILRNVVDSGINNVLGIKSTVPIPPPVVPVVTTVQVSSNEDKEKIRGLETENNNLRSLLKEAQNEIATLSKAHEDQSKSGNATTQELRSKISKLETKVVDLEADLKFKQNELTSKAEDLRRAKADADAALADKSSSSNTLNDQLTQARCQINILEDQLRSAIKEGDAKLEAKVKELTTLADKRVEEVSKKLENEKEVMMDAMTQEVESVEASKKQEKQQLQDKVKSLEASIEPLRQSKNKLSSSIVKVQGSCKSLTKSHASNTQDIKRELTDFKQFMTTMLSGNLIKKIKALDEQFHVLNAKYKRELMERKKLHNIVQELKGNIRVFMRCRPPTAKEIDQFGPDQLCVSFPNPGEVRVFNEKNREKSWEFDEVFGLESTQEEVYRDVSDLVVSVLDGFNVCIFAYGQTGSGKTWTMSGPPDNRGVNFRALNELFERTQARAADCRDVITVSILEVYNEEIRDLTVDPNSQDKLDIRQGEFGNYVPGLTSVPVRNLTQVIDLLAVADRFRSQTQTNMNEHSSRSHMMMTVTIVSENRVTGISSRGKLNLVDLAGSERINKSGATGQALKEAQNINKSLSALGDVIASRAAKQNHVPFRNSTLTYLLQDSLSQDSKTLMIVCASPMLFNSEETFCSLNFASRVRTVELGRATKNVSAGPPSGSDSSGRISPSISSGGIASMATTSTKRQSIGSTGTR